MKDMPSLEIQDYSDDVYQALARRARRSWQRERRLEILEAIRRRPKPEATEDWLVPEHFVRRDRELVPPARGTISPTGRS